MKNYEKCEEAEKHFNRGKIVGMQTAIQLLLGMPLELDFDLWVLKIIDGLKNEIKEIKEDDNKRTS